MHVWARVVSRPEPGLALLDAGKRDVPFDEGLPEPQLAADALGGPARPLAGEITAVNDQHAFLRLTPGTALGVGHVVRLGLSHPCTAFDKWRWIPMVAGPERAGPGGRRPRPHLLLRTRKPCPRSSAPPPSSTAPERPRYRADVLVDGDRIAAIRIGGRLAPRRPGASTPRPGSGAGVHRHARPLGPADPAEPDHLAKISQGVTTEVLGQDGLSYAPVDDDALAMLRSKIAGWNTDPADFDFTWRTVGEYLDRLDAASPAMRPTWSRTAWSGRWSGLGRRAGHRRRHRRDERDRRAAMAEGAVGLSAGLTYTPGMYADTAELVALCEVVAELGGFYAPHHRSYGAGRLPATPR